MSVVNLLQQTWINEQSAPEILVYEADIVHEVHRHVKHQQDLIDGTRQTGQEEFLCNIYQMEIDRTRYMLSAYLRCRLHKIERHALHIVMDPDMSAKLSKPETEHAKGYLDLLEKHFNALLLDHIPDRHRELTTQNESINMVDKPDTRQHVFLRVQQDIGLFNLGEAYAQQTELKKGDMVAGSYETFRGLLLEEQIDLI